MYSSDYDKMNTDWHDNMTSDYPFAHCTLRSRAFYSLKIFDMHTLLFHLMQTPWPSWIILYATDDFILDLTSVKLVNYMLKVPKSGHILMNGIDLPVTCKFVYVKIL